MPQDFNNNEPVDTSVDVHEEVPAEPQKPQERLFTQEEVNNIVEKRLNKEKNKWKNEVDQAKRLAEMSAEDKGKKIQEFLEVQKIFPNHLAILLLFRKKLQIVPACLLWQYDILIHCCSAYRKSKKHVHGQYMALYS